MINVIDQDKCIGCGTCFKSCSLDVFRLDTDQSKVSPCMAACPAGTDIRGYNALVQQGKLEEAAQKLRQANPFPGITGRISFHPCEKECARNAVDGAVNINAVEQFLGDLDQPEEQPAVRHTAKVAVVGSGPAGLSCACFMARMGYPVTVFEAAPRPGGMLRYGIPAYRLPDAVVEAHVARLEALGVSFRCNTRIGKGGDLTLGDLRRRGYKAFLLAPGTSLSRRIAIEGAELPGVLWGVEFLRAVRAAATETGTQLVLDEIQSGYGRTGRFFAHQAAGIRPDLITTAKGMANGFPIGGVLIAPHFEARPGLLGTTFGGSHLACAAAIAVLEVIERDALVENAAEIGDYLLAELHKIGGLKEVRGRGLMIGIEIDGSGPELRKKLLFDKHIFTGGAGASTVRLLPALCLTKEMADRFLTAFDKVKGEK